MIQESSSNYRGVKKKDRLWNTGAGSSRRVPMLIGSNISRTGSRIVSEHDLRHVVGIGGSNLSCK